MYFCAKTIMRNLLLLLLLLILTVNLFGQLNFKNINLNDYKEPDYKYRSLYLYLNLEGNGNIGITSDKFNDYTSGNGYSALNLNTDCRVIKNNRKKQYSRYTRIGVRPDMRINKAVDQDVSNQINLSFNLINNTFKKYYIFRKMFFETDIRLQSGNLVKTDIKGEEGSISSNNILRFPLLIGFGRIENVTNLWHAIRIVEDLDNDGVIREKATFSEDDIHSLANFITERNYTRSFDYRKKLKQDIIGLRNSVLRDKVNFNNPLAYASLFDMWQNGVNTLRRSGYTFALGFEPGVKFYYNDINNSSNIVNSLDLFVMTRFDYARALSKKWQLDLLVELKGGAYDVLLSVEDLNNYDTENLKPAANSKFNLSIGYFPTTRTGFQSSIALFGSVYSPDSEAENVYIDQSFNFTNKLYYYINSRNRLLFHFNIGDQLDYQDNFNFYVTKTRINIDYGIGYVLGIF